MLRHIPEGECGGIIELFFEKENLNQKKYVIRWLSVVHRSLMEKKNIIKGE